MGAKPEMGKYLLYRFFAKHAEIKRYLPDTARYSREQLRRFLDAYTTVFVKPVAGSQGKGIIKVWKSGANIYVKKTIQSPIRCQTFEKAVQTIDSFREGKVCIVQKGLSLFKIQGRPVDFRVMMQRERPGGPWKCSGVLAKVAGPGSVVTNVALSRGYVLHANDALTKGLGWPKAKANQCVEQMKRLGLVSAKHFDSYQFYRELGFDVAVDTSGKIWLIEQNTAPSHPLFRKLKSDLSMYRLIQFRWSQYQKALRQRRA